MVASGTAIAQAIAIVFSPVITRLYGPVEFGILGAFMALAAVFSPIAALTYPIAIVLPKNDRDANGIARLSLYIALGMTAAVAVIIMLVGDFILEVLELQAIQSYILLLPVTIFFAAWLQVNQQWIIRREQFRVKAKVAVLQSFIVNATKSAVGLVKPMGVVLIVITTIGSALHAAMLNYGLRKKNTTKSIENGNTERDNLMELANKYKDFPLYRAPLQLINNIAVSIPILILSAFFGAAAAGFFVLSSKMLNKPTEMIGKSVADVFYSHIANAAKAHKEITPLIIKTTMGLFTIGLPFCIIVVIFGPAIFSFVFGQEWYVAGEYARWVSVWMLFVLVNKPSVRALPVISKQKVFLILTIIARVIAIASMFIGYFVFNNDVVVVAALCVTTSIFDIILIAYTISSSRRYDRQNVPGYSV